MPNHITNILRIGGEPQQIKEMMEAIKEDEYGIGSIDFNKIIPMPKSLSIEAGSRTDKGLKAYRDFIEVYTLSGTVEQDLLNIPLDCENAFLRMRTDISRSDWNLGKIAFQNIQKYGAPTWYEWSIQHWGTKWNAYDFPDKSMQNNDAELRFMTAWSAPHPIIQTLAEKYPSIDFIHEWADEDIGHNCGRHEFHNGQRVSEYYPENDQEAIEFAEKVMETNAGAWGLFLNASETDYIVLPRDEFETVEILGQTALFANHRMNTSEIPKGMYLYHLRNSDDGEAFATIEPSVAVNHGGSVITKQPINFGEEGYISFNDENYPNFTGESMTLEKFYYTDLTQNSDESAGMDGMSQETGMKL